MREREELHGEITGSTISKNKDWKYLLIFGGSYIDTAECTEFGQIRIEFDFGMNKNLQFRIEYHSFELRKSIGN